MASAPRKKVLGGRLASSAISLTVHTGLIFGAVVGTLKPAEKLDDVPIATDVVFIDQSPEKDVPPPKALDRPPPTMRRALVAPVQVPTGIPPVDWNQRFDLDDLNRLDMVESDWFGVDEDTIAGSFQVFSVAAVDEAPVRISSPPLEYPRMMRQAGINGVVLVQAIVDTSGRVKAGSIQVLQSSQSAFETAAKRLVQRSLFQPGRVQGRAVRVLIQIPVVFELVGHNR